MFKEAWTRLKWAWRALRFGAPTDLSTIRDLLATDTSEAVRQAVVKVMNDPTSHPTRAMKRSEVLEWATTYEHGRQQPWTWRHSFLLEYWVGKEKGYI